MKGEIIHGKSGKKRVLLVFGGKSAEHEVSIVSARSVLRAFDAGRFEVFPWYINTQGHFTQRGEIPDALHEDFYFPESFPYLESVLNPRHVKEWVDVVFPVLHGSCGEDGVMQGLFEFLDIPYVGSGVLGSSLMMDKALSKSIFRSAGFPVLPYISFHAHQWHNNKTQLKQDIHQLSTYPYFVKPANQGSSIGISKVNKDHQLEPAIENALRYDNKVLVEKGIQARELEIALLGNESIRLSIIGEIRTSNEFYDYKAKYHSNTTQLIIPATIDDHTRTSIQSIARKAFEVCSLSGLARADFLFDEQNGQVYLNEINTIPGFTSGSMYPKLWEASSVPYSEILTQLIDLAFQRYSDGLPYKGLGQTL